MATPDQFARAVDLIVENAPRDDAFINGGENQTWTTKSGQVRPSASKALKDFQTAGQQAITGVLVPNYRGEWAPGTAYQPNDGVGYDGQFYVAINAHTSSANFQSDLDAGHWDVRQGITNAVLAGPNATALIGYEGRTAQEKLGDIISPKEYGAIQDGQNDDTAAVAAAKVDANSTNNAILVSLHSKVSASATPATRSVETVVTTWAKKQDVDWLPQFMATAYAGGTVGMYFFGDSTEQGADPANLATNVAEPSPLRLQNILRSYYGNNNITVTNFGLGGSTLRQMLAGTDASGQTFEARVAALPAGSTVAWNHGINDCGVGIPIWQFKADQHEAINICRKYGMSVLVITPFIGFPFGFGDRRETEELKLYAQTARQAAEEAGVMCVDNHMWMSKIYQTGKYKAAELLPDGVHGPQWVYQQMGNNFAIPFVGQNNWITGPDQFVGTWSANALGSGNAGPAPSSRMGGGLLSGASNGRIRVAVVVSEPGLDIYVALAAYNGGATDGVISFDRQVVASGVSFLAGMKPPGDQFLQDHEILIARNVNPGLHFIEVESNGGMAAYYVRSRKASLPARYAMNTSFVEREVILEDFDMNPSGAGATVLFDEIPTSRLLDGYEFEVIGTFPKLTGFVVNGCYSGDTVTTASGVHPGYLFALDQNGYPTIYENRGNSNYTLFTGPAEDLSGTEIRIRAVATPGVNGTLSMYVNDSLLTTTPVAVSQPYYGGWFGVFANAAGTPFRIRKAYRVTR